MKKECTACDGAGWIYVGDYPCGPQCCGAKYEECKACDGNGYNLLSHNERVIHALEQLLNIVDIEAAIAWMLAHNTLLNAKPIDMVDERYEELLEAINLFQKGRPE